MASATWKARYEALAALRMTTAETEAAAAVESNTVLSGALRNMLSDAENKPPALSAFEATKAENAMLRKKVDDQKRAIEIYELMSSLVVKPVAGGGDADAVEVTAINRQDKKALRFELRAGEGDVEFGALCRGAAAGCRRLASMPWPWLLPSPPSWRRRRQNDAHRRRQRTTPIAHHRRRRVSRIAGGFTNTIAPTSPPHPSPPDPTGNAHLLPKSLQSSVSFNRDQSPILLQHILKSLFGL